MSALAARIPSRDQVSAYFTWRRLPFVLAIGVVVFAVAYVLFIATLPAQFGVGNWRTTTFGSAVHDPSNFLKIALDSITFAAALFIVASGFALIFGLMRAVNMAHGSFYLLAGYIAYEVQQGMTGQGFSLQSSDVNTWEWLLPLVVAAPCIAVVGLVVQQAFLRWNQGQELRQALITIAISVIVADQIIAHFPRNTSQGQRFGGNAVDLTWPGWTDRFVDLHIGGVQYSLARLVMLGIGVAVGVGLWVWLYRTKTGMVIRAGVDDEQMTSALGINIQRTFAIAFVVGSALAALGAVVWASQSNISSGQDGVWLLNSLVVVIVGGMGSIFGAAAGAILFAFVSNFGASYLPTTGSDCCTQYSSILTFVLIALVLAFRPRGLFGRGN
ncbi:MAG TPA: branched-chain amino acid ABC transporter permease [Gaiellaceae bacterium]|nr:branched-chain amino acid ABC transporter permease [Gaiellaceae bacterium]